MNIINWFKNKLGFTRVKYKIELLPTVFESFEGQPFREEKYIIKQQEQKIEFFDLTQSKYYLNFLQIKQYVVWTMKNDVCRVFIAVDFYQKFELFYQKEINIIYMSFLYDVSAQRLFIYRKFNFLFLFLFFILISFCFYFIFVSQKLLFLSALFLFFIVFSFFFVFRVKCLLKYKEKRLNEARKEVKCFLGAKKYEKLVEQQRLYQPLDEITK